MNYIYTWKHLTRIFILGIAIGITVGAVVVSPGRANQSHPKVVVPIIKEDTSLIIKRTIWDVASNIKDESRKSIVEDYALLAVHFHAIDNFPASLRLAQMILEGGFGSKMPNGSIIYQMGNNPFGISYWRENYPTRITNWDERVTGWVASGGRKYMKFNSVKNAFHVHSDFVTKGHYAAYVKSETPSYDEWLKALVVHPPKNMRYAEDPNYYSKIVSIINRYNLDELDTLKYYVSL